MKLIKSLIMVLMLAIVGLAYTTAMSDDETRKELEAVYAKIGAAIEARDMKTLESLLADDYEKQSGGKTIKRAEAVERMKKSFDVVKDIESVETKIDKIQQVEGNQIVDYTQTAKVTVTGEDGKDKSVTITNKGRDWWVKGEDGKWLCVSAEEIE